MAIAKLTPLLDDIRGAVGDLVFRRYGRRIVVSRKPDMSRRVLSTAQQRQVERFRRAAAYAKAALADPKLRQHYETAARTKNKPANALAISDYFNAPRTRLPKLPAAISRPKPVRCGDKPRHKRKVSPIGETPSVVMVFPRSVFPVLRVSLSPHVPPSSVSPKSLTSSASSMSAHLRHLPRAISLPDLNHPLSLGAPRWRTPLQLYCQGQTLLSHAHLPGPPEE